MIQPKYSPEEALQRAKLMMKYDTSKTLNENKEAINEIGPLVIPAITIGAPWLLGGGAAGLAAIGTWIYNVQGGGDSFAKTKAFFDGCNTQFNKLKPTLDKSQHREAASQIYNAVEGLGTDEDAIREALMSMPTVADLCQMYKFYQQTYGDLYKDLDGDIDGEDFRKYVWSAMAGQIADAQEDLEKAQDETVTQDEKKKTGQKREGGTGYKSCSGTYSFGCKSEKIAQVQACLGLVVDGKFGPKTQKALKNKGFDSFTDADYNKICATKEVDTDIEDVDSSDFDTIIK